ncbi:hypothetical protein EMIT0158MI4_150209 [Burkholderia ambifaria]
MQQAVTRSLAWHRVYTQGIASNTGTERSVPVYGMNRRACDHESQPGTQTCKSIGDPVHEATITLRERQIPRVKQSASYECTTSRPHWLHRIDGIIRFVTWLLRSWSSHDPRARCIAAVPATRSLPYVYPQHCAHDGATFFATRL